MAALRRTRIRTALRATRAGVLVAALVPALALVAPVSAAPRPGMIGLAGNGSPTGVAAH